MLGLELAQKKLSFGTAFPLLSSAVAVSCIVDSDFRFLDGPVTSTTSTAPGLTVMVAVPFTSPTLAVIVALPAFDVATFAVVFPVEFGAATCTSSDVQVTVPFVTTVP